MDLTKFRVSLKDCLGPLQEDRGKAPVKKRLGPLKGSQTTIQAGSHTNPSNNNKGKAPMTDYIGLRVEVQEPVRVSRSQKRKSERVTLGDANEASYP